MPGSLRYPHALIALCLACGTAERELPADPGLEANRVSMALRGVPPSAAELSWVRKDPGALDALTDQWLFDPRFAETVGDWHAEMLLLRHDTQVPLPPRGPLAGVARGAIGDALAEAPLRQVVELVRAGRPYSELFEGRAVAVNAESALVWGLPYDVETGGWQTAYWADDRPSAGILVDANLWSRHLSSDTNHHRARANLVHRVWLCEDLSARTIELGDVDLDDPDAVSDAVRNQPECAGCHDTLDPLASTFAGWRRYVLPTEIGAAHDAQCADPEYCYPIRMWAPDAVATREVLGLPPAALGGVPVSDLAELGQAVVADPRFGTCVAAQMAAYLGQQDLQDVPAAEAERLGGVFVESGHDLRALARAVVRAPRFAAQGGDLGALVARPEQVARTVESLTGMTWVGDPDAGDCGELGCWGSVELGRNARWGYREIAGGIDGYDSHHPIHAPQPLRHLAVGRMAEEAAGQLVVVESGLPPGKRRLLREIDDLQEVRPAPVQRQIARLHERLLGAEADSAEVARSYGLWEAVHVGSGSAERAWAALIGAMLQSPERVLY